MTAENEPTVEKRKRGRPRTIIDNRPQELTCKRLGCGKTFKRKRRKMYCSEECSRACMLAQLKSHGERRKQNTPTPSPKPCPICEKEFTPTRGKMQKYCPSPVCKEEGQRRAIAAQTVRREKARQERKTSAPEVPPNTLPEGKVSGQMSQGNV